MQADLNRLATTAHYVIARTDPSELGATKLNKILWFSDLEHYRNFGRTITGLSQYVRMPYGPVPRRIKLALNKLKHEGAIVERQTQVITYDRREFVWLKEPNVGDFSPQEIDMLNIFIDIIRKQPAGFISDVTHDDPLWQELNNGEMMSVRAGAVIPRAPTPAELAWAQSKAA